MSITSLQFDAQTFAKENNISIETLNKLIKDIRLEFPDDEMMFELHLIRALLQECGKL